MHHPHHPRHPRRTVAAGTPRPGREDFCSLPVTNASSPLLGVDVETTTSLSSLSGRHRRTPAPAAVAARRQELREVAQ